MTQLDRGSTTDLNYLSSEVDRSIAPINSNFMRLDGGGPIRSAITKARAKGHVALLDACCGTGYGLIDLKNQVSFRAPIAEDAIEAAGISLADYRHQFTGRWREKAHFSDGYATLRIGNLDSIQLEPEHFDVAYSYEVLLHNKDIAPIIHNVMTTLCAGGVYYFDALVDQQEQIDVLAESLDPAEWRLDSKIVTRQFIDEEDSRMMHRILRVGRDCTS